MRLVLLHPSLMSKRSVRSPRASRKAEEITVPSMAVWNTTDAQELARRQQRAREESFVIRNLEPRHPVFSNFEIQSGSGLNYRVEIRDLATRRFSCQCVDFRINGLGSCKHVEAVLNHLEGRFKRLFAAAAKSGTPRLDLVPDEVQGTLRLEGPAAERNRLPKAIRSWFGIDLLAKPKRYLIVAPFGLQLNKKQFLKQS